MTATTAAGEGPGRRSWSASSPWYLAYLGMLAFQPVFDPGSGPVTWAASLALVAVFVPFYLHVERSPGRARRWSPVVAAALGVLVLPVNTGASVLFVYAAAFAGSYRPRPEALRWMAGLSAVVLVLAVLSPIPFPYRLLALGPPLLFIWVVGAATLDEAERERDAAALRVENARIEQLATLTERERLARDLHDLLGHSLTSVVVRAQLARRLVATDPERAAAELVELERTARTALTEVRSTVSGWRQVLLDDELATARDTLTAAGVDLVVDAGPRPDLAPTAEAALALALREAVTNVVRHAGATRCTVALRRDRGSAVLEVRDDGVGAGAAEGGGLTGMRERLAALGGSVTRTGSGPGTSLVVSVPAPGAA